MEKVLKSLIAQIIALEDVCPGFIRRLMNDLIDNYKPKEQA